MSGPSGRRLPEVHNPKPSKRPCLPKFQPAWPQPNALSTDHKSRIMTVKISDNLRFQTVSREQMQRSGDSSLLTDNAKGNVGPETASLADQGDSTSLVVDTSLSTSGMETGSKQKRQRDRSNKVRPVIASESSYFVMTSWQSKLLEWITLRDSTLDELLRLDGLGSFIGHEACSNCLKTETMFRCLDCGHGIKLLCQRCLVNKHHELELHRILVSYVISMHHNHGLPAAEVEWKIF